MKFAFLEELGASVVSIPFQVQIMFRDRAELNQRGSRPICRPTRDQDVYYNGMVRCHIVEFLTITLVNGHFAYVSGAHAGIRHGAKLFRDHLQPLLATGTVCLPDQTPLCVLADAGFPSCFRIQAKLMSTSAFLRREAVVFPELLLVGAPAVIGSTGAALLGLGRSCLHFDWLTKTGPDRKVSNSPCTSKKSFFIFTTAV
eukprot:m.464303 g.464303  ORF g.464303 m.464303 type:complete len:200 (-) comp57046_c0_seq7:1520-2119(-)